MVIFHSYVSLPECILFFKQARFQNRDPVSPHQSNPDADGSGGDYTGRRAKQTLPSLRSERSSDLNLKVG